MDNFWEDEVKNNYYQFYCRDCHSNQGRKEDGKGTQITFTRIEQ